MILQAKVGSIFQFHNLGEPSKDFGKRLDQLYRLEKQMYDPHNTSLILTFENGLDLEYKQPPPDNLDCLGVNSYRLHFYSIFTTKRTFF